MKILPVDVHNKRCMVNFEQMKSNLYAYTTLCKIKFIPVDDVCERICSICNPQ